ncbi:MAG: diaminopimelate decarboxylase [Clostridia bacterium]|nr:diaminopimelate decarboxylase [Clostridia bacterium]
MICENLTAVDGVLHFAGQNTADLAAQYGTPLYLMDENRIRQQVAVYRDTLRECFGDKGHALYASKACAFKRMYAIMAEEGISVDVVSAGEMATAYAAGFPMENVYFHSNNKTDFDIAYAMDCGVGTFVVDHPEELTAINAIASEKGIVQPVILRITPGIDCHTYEAVNTGKVDSKFGSAIVTGDASRIVKQALDAANVKLCGFHCHIGSQVFDSSVYIATVDVMVEFLAEMKKTFGYSAEKLDIGGGYGVRYVATDPVIDIAASIREVAQQMQVRVAEAGIEMPHIYMEPGRSIVADAGLTLYTVGAVKKIEGYKNYVSVDGGMTDNPRFALYGSEYTVLPATRLEDERDMVADVVGRCCESGDIIQPDVALPADMARGELLAVLTTGAYNYSMASNYNRIPRPPVVMLRDGESYVAVRRETLEDILALDK